MVDNKLTLGYWGIRGRGQVSRLLLEFTGQSYNDKKYTKFEDWFASDKNNLGLEFPNLPYVVDGDFKLTESKAVEKYIIYKANQQDTLLGNDAISSATITMIGSVIGDVFTEFGKLAFNPQFESLKEATFNDKLKPKLDQLQAHLGKNLFFRGNQVTYADFQVYEVLNGIFAAFPNKVDSFPQLKQHQNNFEEVPQIKAYLASDRYQARPFYPPGMATWTGL